MNRAKAIVLLVALVVLLAGCAAQRLEKRGDELLAANQPGEAVRRYEEALAKKPELAEKPEFQAKLRRARTMAAYYEGVGLAARGDHEAAIEAFERSIALGPDAAEAPARLDQARRDAARARLAHALELADQGNLNEALDDLHRARELNPDDPDVRSALASTSDRPADAADGADAHFRDGLTLRDEKRWDRAAEAFQAAIAANRNHVLARLRLHEANGKLAEARKDQAEGSRRLEARDLDAAIDALQHALAVWPQFGKAQVDLATARQRRAVAQGHLDHARDLAASGDWDAATRSARAALGVFANWREATDFLSDATHQAAVAHVTAGNGLLEQNRLDEAEAEFKAALTYEDGFQAAAEGLALADMARGGAAERDGLWGNALVWYTSAVAHVSRASYREAVARARDEIVRRNHFTLSLVPGAAGAGDEAARALAAVVRETTQRRPAYMEVVEGDHGDYRAEIGLARLDVTEHRVGTEQRTHNYTVRQDVPNPEIPRLTREIALARGELTRLRREARSRCTWCSGRGWQTCDHCGGDGRIDGKRCRWCDGRGRIACSHCDGRGFTISVLKRHEAERKADQIERLERQLRGEPDIVTVDAPAEWPYVVETFEKAGVMALSLQVADADGRVVHTDRVEATSSDTDTTIANANPSVGLASDPLSLPTDAAVRDALRQGVAAETANRLIAALANLRVKAAQVRAESLSADGRGPQAVEAYADAAVLLEPINAPESRRVIAQLQESLEGK